MHKPNNFCVTNYMLNKLKPTIAVIDSGIGGVSVLKALINKYKAGNYIYFADNLYMPYGNKSKSFIKNRIESLIDYLNGNYKPDYIFIACNTASSVLTNKKSNVKFIDFENLSYPMLATKLTAKQLNNPKVIADNTLAGLIEHNIENKKLLTKNIQSHVKKFKLDEFDTLILGCTHYELAKDIFSKFCPKTNLICNGEQLINSFNFNPEQSYLSIKILLSSKNENYETKIKNLLKNEVI